MQDGYPEPREMTKKGESEMVLRFNGTDIFYDPTVETGDDIGDAIEDDDTLPKVTNEENASNEDESEDKEDVDGAKDENEEIVPSENEENLARKTIILGGENQQASLVELGKDLITGHSSNGAPLTSSIIVLVNLVTVILKLLMF